MTGRSHLLKVMKSTSLLHKLGSKQYKWELIAKKYPGNENSYVYVEFTNQFPANRNTDGSNFEQASEIAQASEYNFFSCDIYVCQSQQF